jgi:signal transduction histidine kinase
MTERRRWLTSYAIFGLAGLFFTIDLYLPLGVAAGTPYVLVVLLAAWLPNRRMPLYLAGLCSVLTLAGAWLSPAGGILWMGLTNRALGLTMLWVTAVLVMLRRRGEEKVHLLNRELDAFVHTVSHDLRSPLSPILGFADYLREEHGHCLREEGNVAVDEIERQGLRMLGLLDDLLQLAMVGHLERPAAPIDANRVLQGVLEGWREQAAAAGVELRCGQLPPAPVAESLLSQILDNLVGNAVRYAAGGGLIDIGGEHEGGAVRYFVRDHGPGVPPGERERIFEPFSRGAAGRVMPGTGIGLATVRKIAVHFGGRAWVEETPGGGSTFWVELTAEQGRRS